MCDCSLPWVGTDHAFKIVLILLFLQSIRFGVTYKLSETKKDDKCEVRELVGVWEGRLYIYVKMVRLFEPPVNKQLNFLLGIL